MIRNLLWLLLYIPFAPLRWIRAAYRRRKYGPNCDGPCVGMNLEHNGIKFTVVADYGLSELTSDDKQPWWNQKPVDYDDNKTCPPPWRRQTAEGIFAVSRERGAK